MYHKLTDKAFFIPGRSKGNGAGCVEVFAAEAEILVIVSHSPKVEKG